MNCEHFTTGWYRPNQRTVNDIIGMPRGADRGNDRQMHF